MVGSIHMDMDAAGTVDFGPCSPHPTDTLLEFGKFFIGEFWCDHFHTVTGSGI